MQAQVEAFTVRRLTVAVPTVRAFQLNYEAAVPQVPDAQIIDLVRRGAPWSQLVDLIESAAPYGFLLFAKNDAHPLMRLAGDRADCLWYLMGNHVLAERMFRHDRRAMLYAPLRTAIWEDPTGGAWFSVDQPSTHFASLGNPEVAEVGAQLDRKLATLLQALGTDVPVQLLNS